MPWAGSRGATGNRTLADANVDRGVARFSQSRNCRQNWLSRNVCWSCRPVSTKIQKRQPACRLALRRFRSCQRGCQNFGPVVWCLTGRISSRECLVPVSIGEQQRARGFLGEHALSVPLSTMPGGFHECDRHHHQRDCPTHTRIELHPLRRMKPPS